MKNTMKALIFPSPWRVELIEIEIPRPGPDEVLAEIRCVGICGSDVGIYEGTHWIVAHGPGGHGHETGAVAVEVGKNVKGIQPGDHLARMGAGYAQYSTHVNVVGHGKDETLGALPIVRNDLTPEEISFADAVGCALNCAERAELDRIEGRTPKAIVLGLGSIGLILTQILIHRGVEVAASEPYEHKRRLAHNYGASVFNPREFRRPTHGRKTYVDHIKEEFGEADAVFEMVGNNDTLLDAIDLVRPGFRVLVFGAQKIQMIPYEICRKKGVELVYPEAMVNSKQGIDYWNAALDLIAGKDGNKLQLTDLITDRISLADAVKAFEFYDREKWIKILVEPFRD
ncbi:MAG: zinc-binding alcohol dehydrogenase family protein [Candidatus Abyssubacteria bacterium]